MVQTILLALMFMKLNSAKLLTATYESEFKTDSAWLYLQQIPDDNAENTAFKELYTQLLNGIDPPAGSGKAMGMQELYLRQSAMQEQNAHATIAQAINASYYGEIYYKNIQPKSTKQIANTSLENKLLTIYPNPATNIVHFTLPYDSNQFKVIVTDLLGKQVATILLANGNMVWNTENLSSGMYFCILVNQNRDIVETHKLVIYR
mgnify:CR=1 FL=1